MIANVVWLVSLICTVWVIYDVYTVHKAWKMDRKLIWTICAVLFGVITAGVYYFKFKK
ncbi:MAG: hypothetical protein QF915_03845 [Candidatus Woesearchaeota archaeon]|jgi:membrane protein DedA with SNARE-associated domain|nr:hypothetical protein [Candidatus Woesearchaeota archaeon]MDP7457786.1 hypothetical protein [Candidatus Woesearchaeota archaeon]